MRDDDANTTAVIAAPTQVLASDPLDLAGLYLRHHSAFCRHARRYLRDQRDADDVVQEAFLRMFLALPELETELQALAYGRRTITNLCIDRYRAQARRPSLVDLDTASVEDFADVDPGDPVVRAEDAETVQAALARLAPLHRAALVKREIEEKPLPVIAHELDIPEDNVKHLLHRARRALRRLLAGTSVAPGADEADGRRVDVVTRAGSRGLAVLLALLVVGLGTGPDLRAVPVVGVDLPDVLGVTRAAEAVGTVVDEVVGGLVPDAAPRSAPGPGPAEVSVPRSGAQAPTAPGPAAEPGSRSAAEPDGFAGLPVPGTGTEQVPALSEAEEPGAAAAPASDADAVVGPEDPELRRSPDSSLEDGGPPAQAGTVAVPPGAEAPVPVVRGAPGPPQAEPGRAQQPGPKPVTSGAGAPEAEARGTVDRVPDEVQRDSAQADRPRTGKPPAGKAAAGQAPAGEAPAGQVPPGQARAEAVPPGQARAEADPAPPRPAPPGQARAEADPAPPGQARADAARADAARADAARADRPRPDRPEPVGQGRGPARAAERAQEVAAPAAPVSPAQP